MATFQNRDVFEFCEKIYKQLEQEDKGYYAKKHDAIVFQRAAAQFNASKEEAERAYSSYSKLAANINMMKINRLPKAKRKEAMMRNLQDLMLNNKDLPYYKIEGEPSKPLPSAMDLIEEEYSEPLVKIAQSGWTIPRTIDVERLDELKICAVSQYDIDVFFEKFYSDDELETLIEVIADSISSVGQKKRFDECCTIFKQGLYSTCLTTLTTILEGTISSFGDDPKDVRIMKICDFHVKEEKGNGNKIKSLCWQSIYEYSKLLFEKSDFSQSEPSGTNRHWLVHGRTNKIGEKIDCLRIFNALATLSNLT